MRKIIYYAIALVALAAAAETALAIPAKRGTFTYTQPDGSTIVLQRVGDERMHATLDASGNPMVMDENGFYVRASVATRSGDAPSPVVRTHLGARRKVAPATDMTIGTRYIPVLLVEFIKFELPARLFFIIAQGPNVACINEECPIDFPEEESAIFCIQVNLHVARLIDEVNGTICAMKLTRSESSYIPTSY